ncbi:MAG: hypothetical protein M1832_006087, partial [Thelocarpon impressellum]
MARDPEQTLATLAELQAARELSIIGLGEPIAPPPEARTQADGARSSDASADAADSPSPATLEADLAHYKVRHLRLALVQARADEEKELFSKLRFSYLEQVTKEKFLRAIVGDPPLVVEAAENVELEAQLAEVKAALRVQKAEVAGFVAELERRGRELSRRHEGISLQRTTLATLPASMSSLQTSVAELQTALAPPDAAAAPTQSLPLPATLSLLGSREAELAALDAQLKSLQGAELPRKTRQLERAQAELRPLEARRAGSAAAARE